MSDDFDSYGSYEYGTSSRRGRKSKWDKKFEEKVPKGGFLDWTLALLMLSAFGYFVWYNRHGQTPTNHAKSADEVAAERAVESQQKSTGPTESSNEMVLIVPADSEGNFPEPPALPDLALPDLSGDGLPSLWGDKKDLADVQNGNPNEWISFARRQLRLLVQTPLVQYFKVGETIRIKREIRNVSSSPLFVPLSEKGVGEVGMLQAFIERLGEEKIIPPMQTKYVRGQPSVYGAGGRVLESSILINPEECLQYVGDAKINTKGYLPGEYLYSVHFSKSGKLIDYAEYKFVLE